MPVQRTLFGRPVRLQLPPRRFQILFGTLVFFLVAFWFIPVPERVERAVDSAKEKALDSIPDAAQRMLNTAHKPPVQANSTSGEASWFNDWKWRNPFSSSITLDEDRAVLPLLKTRPFVYTYYEPKKGIEKAILAAEEKLLLVWRRAWWAQGFRPIVLGRAEAMNNELYTKFKLTEKDLDKLDADDDGLTGLGSGTEYEVLRWLAWGNMGTGVLMNWLALPMAPRDDVLLDFLRRGDFESVTHFSTYGNNLFCGEKTAINALLSSVLNAPERLSIAGSVISAAHNDHFTADPSNSGIALYDLATIRTNYGPVADAMTTESQEAEGLEQLAELMNAHLHIVWQNTFPEGIAVLKPLKHMTTLVEPAMEIAKRLQKCSPSPMTFTCPPNVECKICEETEESKLPLTTIPAYRNSTDTFLIGSVPHPYTSTTLHNWHKGVDIPYIRRESKRDIWLASLTKEQMGGDIGSSRRIVAFKEAVAGDYAAHHSMWLTAEKEDHKDLNWFFGFSLPAVEKDTTTTAELAELNTTALEVPGDSVIGSVTTTRVPAPGEPQDRELASEREMLQWARMTLNSKDKDTKKIREAVEAWNMADTEAWRFARAYSARRRVERLKWEEEEHKFAGSEKPRGRWFS